MENIDSLTPQQLFEMVQEENSERAVARKLGKHHSWVQRRIASLKDNEDTSDASASDAGDLFPENLILKRVSTLFDHRNNETMLEWRIKDADKNKRREQILKAFDALCDRLPPAEPVPAPDRVQEDLCNLYTLTDYHLGMYASAALSGTEWNTEIAKRALIECFRKMISLAPRAEECVINIQGDFLHSDSLLPVTPTSGHVLDQDMRMEDLADVAMEVIEELINIALVTHKRIIVLIAEGNHDISSSMWLRKAFARIYRDEPRAHIITEQQPYYAHRWGETALFFHHGHKKSTSRNKLPDLALLFATRFKEIWGRTSKRYGNSGHYHHEQVTELSGIKWTQHPTLSPNDAHATREGYDSERAARFTTYDKLAGEVISGRVTPEML